MIRSLRIGTRESQLAMWQATHVQNLLRQHGVGSTLVPIRSEGDMNTVTPLYAFGVQGIFTKALDSALLSDHIDLAVHSMKDVPIQQAAGLAQAAVLERASYKDILVFKGERAHIEENLGYREGTWQGTRPVALPLSIATSSIRRRAQWLHRYPHHTMETLRGNVNTRLRKLEENAWNGVIFAAAGLERINLRPTQSIDLDWMLPAPAQGAITVSCRAGNAFALDACRPLNHPNTEVCTRVERDFLKALLGGCSTPISALAVVVNDYIDFKGNMLSPDGKYKTETREIIPVAAYRDAGKLAAQKILDQAQAKEILTQIRLDKHENPHP